MIHKRNVLVMYNEVPVGKILSINLTLKTTTEDGMLGSLIKENQEKEKEYWTFVVDQIVQPLGALEPDAAESFKKDIIVYISDVVTVPYEAKN